MNRVGIGFDLHRLKDDRALVIGGVSIDHSRGLDGHSDADVLLHALIDALLGAAGMRDIGYHFPADDASYKDISSLKLLEQVKQMLENEHWKLLNADMVIIAEEPAMSSYIESMKTNIAEILSVPESLISVKATTTEGLGICGRKEGIAAQAVVMLTEQ